MARQTVTVNRGPGMTFDEIAAAMGEKTSTVSMVYASAMRKLKSRPELLLTLQCLAVELDTERSRRTIVELIYGNTNHRPQEEA